MSERVALLRDISYFEALPTDELEQVARVSRVITLESGEALFHEGDPAEGLYLVVRGGVRAVRYSPEGRQLIVREFHPGETFNEVGALDGSENAATAITTANPTEVLIVPGEKMRQLTREYPDFGQQVMRAMAEKLRYAMGKVNRLALMVVKARLASHLLESATDTGVLKGISQEELAAQLGTVRQVLGRALSEMQKAGIVEVGRGFIRIIDRDALEAIVEGA